MANLTNKELLKGFLTNDLMRANEVFIDVLVNSVLPKGMVKIMAPNPIVFAIANLIPEIMPGEA